MQIVFLGTASCYPTPRRGVSCTAMRFDDGDVWVFDCGEGSQIQLQKSALKIAKISKIFVTHLHGDHLFGLPGLICTIGSQAADRKDLLEIYGPQGLRKYIRQSLSLSRSPLPFNYVVHELLPNDDQFPEDWSLWTVNHTCNEELHPQEIIGQDICGVDNTWHLLSDEKAVVKAGPILHRVPCFGFVITEHDQPGTLNVEMLKSLGVPPGPLYGKLKRGESVTLSEGHVIEASQVLGPIKRGRKVTILGDTHDPSRLTTLAMNSNIVIHEATMEDALKDKAISFGHSTPSMAATFAKNIKAKKLILFHFSQRFQANDKKTDEQHPPVEMLKEEANSALSSDNSCEVMLAEDLLHIPVNREI